MGHISGLFDISTTQSGIRVSTLRLTVFNQLLAPAKGEAEHIHLKPVRGVPWEPWHMVVKQASLRSTQPPQQAGPKSDTGADVRLPTDTVPDNKDIMTRLRANHLQPSWICSIRRR